jgi:hypothetical protein
MEPQLTTKHAKQHQTTNNTKKAAVGGELNFVYYVSILRRKSHSTPPFCNAEFIAKHPTGIRYQIKKSNPTIEGPPIFNLMYSFSIRL